MDKRSKNSNAGDLGVVGEVSVDSESIAPYNYEVKPKTVKLQSVFDARLTYTGLETGKQYEWNKAGSILDVDVLDSETLLAKRIGGTGCCGNSNQDGNVVFIKVS